MVVLKHFVNAISHLYSSACQNNTKDNYKDKSPHHKYKDFKQYFKLICLVLSIFILNWHSITLDAIWVLDQWACWTPELSDPQERQNQTYAR